MRVSAVAGIKNNINPIFKGNKRTTTPWDMDIFESCEPKPLITKKSHIEGKNLDEVYLKPNRYESSIGLYKTRKVLNSKIGKLEGYYPIEVKISNSQIGEASRFKKIELAENVQADKLQSTSAIIISGDNTKVNDATTSIMTVCGSEINSLKCETLTAKDSVINSEYIKGLLHSNENNDKKQFLNIYNTKIKSLNINPKGEYQFNNSHVCKIVIPEVAKKVSFYPSISLIKNGNSVIGSFENNSNYIVTIEFYKDGKYLHSKLVPPETVYDTETLEKFFEG